MMQEAIAKLETLALENDEGLTYFLKKTEIIDSSVSGLSRIALEDIAKDEVIAVIGGIIIDYRDQFIAMPMGFGLSLHQVSNKHKGTVNHSCNPNGRISGFNRLVAKRDIKQGEELSIDYGTTAVGAGEAIINDCLCNSENCRHVIKNTDYKWLPIENLSMIAKYRRKQIDETGTHY